jgi:hypothetical protein
VYVSNQAVPPITGSDGSHHSAELQTPDPIDLITWIHDQTTHATRRHHHTSVTQLYSGHSIQGEGRVTPGKLPSGADTRTRLAVQRPSKGSSAMVSIDHPQKNSLKPLEVTQV